MAVSKSKYQVSVTKLQRLPPIREESMAGRTPRSGRRPNPEDYLVADKKITVQPLNPKPNIHTRPLPGKTRKVQFEPARPTRSETQILDSYPKTVYKEPPMEPLTEIPPPQSNPHKTIVDGLVADYLHYAQYGHIIPVYEGTGSLSCSCCTDRNRENVRTMLGFPSNPSDKYATTSAKIMGPNPKPDTWLTGSSKPPVPKSPVSNSHSPRFDNTYFDTSQTPRGKDLQRDKWLNYQPTPYASNYANAEFNRPVLVYNHLRESDENYHNYKKHVSNEILDANTKFDDAMKRLEKFSFS